MGVQARHHHQGVAPESTCIAAGRRTPERLVAPTTTYGTPLRAALLRGFDDRVRDLIMNGAVLSEDERAQPSVARQLERFLAWPINETARERYRSTLDKARGAK